MYFYKCTLPVIFLLFSLLVTAQNSAYNGDALPAFIGKPKDSPEIKALLENFTCTTSNDVIYNCSNGTEVEFKNGVLEEIYFYSNNFLHGTYSGQLPNKLAFGMSPEQVKATVGKPTLAYNTGYCEFKLDKYTLSCWFENGKLNQLIMGSIE